MVTMTINKVKHKTDLHHRDNKSGNLHMFRYHKLRGAVRGILLSTHPGIAVGGTRWRYIVAGPLFAHCKIAYFNSAVTEHWFVVSLRDFVTLRKILLTMSYKKFSGINTTQLKKDAVEFSHFIRECVAHWSLLSPRSLTVTSTWRPRLTAHYLIGERH